MTDITKKELITLPEVRKILEQVKQDDMDQIQRWTYDYVAKFAKTSAEAAREMVKSLTEQCELKEDEAVEVVNVLPSSLEELRAFTFGWKKLILTETLQKMLTIIKSRNES